MLVANVTVYVCVKMGGTKTTCLVSHFSSRKSKKVPDILYYIYNANLHPGANLGGVESFNGHLYYFRKVLIKSIIRKSSLAGEETG